MKERKMDLKAVVHQHTQIKLASMEVPVAKQGEVIVALRTAGLNRRDLYIPARRGDAKDPLIIGSDGAGIIEAVGEDVEQWKVGDEVIINPSLRWFENSDAPPKTFDILGMPDHGTFAEKIAISAEQIEKKPSHLSWEEAGCLALAALTGYRALFTKGQLQKGQTVFIPGGSSGVSTFMIQFAKNVGARVLVSSRSEEKRNQLLDLGADVAIATDGNWIEQLAGETIDLVIDSVGGETFKKALAVLKKGGRIVTFGATTEDQVLLDIRSFFYNQQQIFGSTMGSREEFRAMIKHIETYNTHPIIDQVIPLENVQQAFQALEKSTQFGKVVLHIQ